MNNGTVRFFNSERGFGYIRTEGSGSDLRVLPSALRKAGIKRLNEGQNVRFDTHTDPDSGKTVVNNIEID